jgi:hypothetical protein
MPHHEQDPTSGGTPPQPERPTEQFPPVGDQPPTVEHPIPPAPGQPPSPPTESFPPATDHGYVTPPPPAPPGDWYGGQGPSGPQEPPKRKGRGKLVALIVGGVILLGGVAFAGVMLVDKVSATPDQMAKMVPAKDQAYVTAYLDPGADQALNLRDLLQRFPALKKKGAGKAIDEGLEELLRPAGLSYVRDIKPWLGTQIAVSGRMDKDGKPSLAVMFASKDDAKALETMKRVEGLSSNADIDWSTETYKGIDIRVSRPSSPDQGTSFGPLGDQVAYAIVDGSLVIANGLDRMKEVVDADQGNGEALSDDPNFDKAVDALPDDVLGMAYVNLGDLLDQVIPELEAGIGFADLPDACDKDEFNKTFDALRAYRGLALSTTAESNGLAIDVAVAIDRSKLPSDAPTAGSSDPHQNVALSFTPEGAFGVVTFAGAESIAKQFDQAEQCADPEAKKQFDEYGVKDILSNLAGDVGVEVNPGKAGGTPTGALIASVKNEAKMQSSLDKLATKLAGESDVGEPVSTTYKGVKITSIQPDPSSDEEFVPTWAVTDGVAIIATSPAEMKAVIDAHQGEDITDDATFQEAAAQVDLEGSPLAYIDVRRVVTAYVAALPDFFKDDLGPTLDNVKPVKATILSAGGDGDVTTVRWFFLIP